MKKKAVFSFVLASTLVSGYAGYSQTAQAPVPAADSVAARSKALSTLFAEIWEDRLKHSPEFASSIGDKRYNDQLTDYSVRRSTHRLRVAVPFSTGSVSIDVTGFSAQEVLSRDLMVHDLTDAQEARTFQGMGDAGRPVQWLSYRPGTNG